MPEFRPQAKVAALAGVFLVTAMLYLGKDFLMPLALSILLAFLLTPVVSRLESWGLGHTPAVVTTALVALSILGVALYFVAGQFVDLAESLPRYRDNLRAKAAALRISETGPLSQVTNTFKDVSNELGNKKSAPPPEPGAPAPVPVAVVEQQPSLMSMLSTYSSSFFGPIGTAAIVIVVVIFMLIGRQDMRDRFIHLVGRGKLHVTTQAIDEAGTRVSRYLMAQLIVNVSYGIPVGVGLYFIGVPNAALWGMLATVLRFVPYIGPWIAATPPILLSFAIAPGWWPPALTIGLFVVLELLSNNVVEPWLYGSSTGLAPMAIIISTIFWTWLWGAGGLLLATPLTVCVAVLGKYVPNLAFLDVLLGDKPPIAPEHRFYQRLLAGDEIELFEMVEKYVAREEHTELFDQVIVPALREAEQDFSKGAITREERQDVYQRVRDALGSIDGFPVVAGPELGAFVIVPARTEGDELAAHMLAFLLEKRGTHGSAVSYRTLTSEISARLESAADAWLCVSALTPLAGKSGEVLLRRLAAAASGRRLLGLWGQHARKHEGVEIAVTLRDAAREIAGRTAS